VSDRPTSGPAPRWGEYGPTPEPAKQPEPLAPAPPPPLRPAGPAAATAHSGPTWDRILTIALLVIGVFNVLTTIPQMLSLPAALDDVYRVQGFGNYTSDALASALGIVINVVSVLLLIVVVVLAIRRLRAGRLAFWIPLVGGATALILTGVLLTVAMVGDPALPAYLENQTVATPTPTP
jgi:hypothetical protein